MKIVKAYSVQMSYDVSDEEKELAEKAIISLDSVLSLLEVAENHLELMHTPFKDNPETTSEEIFKARAALRIYRDRAIVNFNNIKKRCFHSFGLLQQFSSDTQIIKIIKSFTMEMEDLEKQVNFFAELFEDLKDQDFSKNIVKSIELIHKECAKLKVIIEDRIKSYIKENILSRNWVDMVSEELQEKVEDRLPLIQKLLDLRGKTDTTIS